MHSTGMMAPETMKAVFYKAVSIARFATRKYRTKCVVILQPQSFDVRSVAIPQIQDDQVLIKGNQTGRFSGPL
jgi:hypothetical protein